jgi:glycosyltransferase involved in cell wall biosynthesis
MSGAPFRVVQLLAPHAMGGIETMVAALVRELSGRGVEVHVAAMVAAGGAGESWVAQAGRDAASCTVLRPTRSLWREARGLRQIVRATEPALLHAHGYRADILAPLALWTQVPLVATVHGFSPVDRRSRWYSRIDRLALRRFDRVVAVSAALRQELIRSGIRPDRVSVVLNGATVPPPPAPREALRAALGLDPDATVIGTVGRLSPEKGHLYLVRAFGMLAKRFPGATLVIVGDGPEGPRLRAEAEVHGVSERLVLTGNRRDIEALYPVFDIFALPSLTEGCPTALLEAMAYGVPCVAAAVGGVPEVIQEGATGHLVPPGNVPALAAALAALMTDDPGRSVLGAAGQRAHAAAFQLQQWATRTLAVYSAVIADGALSHRAAESV